MKEIKIIGVAGLPGVGKTTASQYLAKEMAIVRMGEVTDKVLREENLPINEKAEKKIRNQLREKYGPAIFARGVASKVSAYLRKKQKVVIEGVRSLAEFEFLVKKYRGLKLLFIEADESARIKRLLTRKDRPLTLTEIKIRDAYEINKLGIKKLQKKADYIIANNSTFKHFYRQLDNILSKK